MQILTDIELRAYGCIGRRWSGKRSLGNELLTRATLCEYMISIGMLCGTEKHVKLSSICFAWFARPSRWPLKSYWVVIMWVYYSMSLWAYKDHHLANLLFLRRHFLRIHFNGIFAFSATHFGDRVVLYEILICDDTGLFFSPRSGTVRTWILVEDGRL